MSKPEGVERLISPSDLRREAERLIAEGRMPSVDTLLKAVLEQRLKLGSSSIESLDPSGEVQ